MQFQVLFSSLEDTIKKVEQTKVIVVVVVVVVIVVVMLTRFMVVQLYHIFMKNVLVVFHT